MTLALSHCAECGLFLRPTDACLHMAALPAPAFREFGGNSGEQGRNALASGALNVPFHETLNTPGVR